MSELYPPWALSEDPRVLAVYAGIHSTVGQVHATLSWHNIIYIPMTVFGWLPLYSHTPYLSYNSPQQALRAYSITHTPLLYYFDGYLIYTNKLFVTHIYVSVIS